MQITLVTAPTITVNPGAKGTWKMMEVLYRTLQGKVETKKLVSFKNPKVFEQVAAAKAGDVFEVESVKGEPDAKGKQYWEWKSVQAVGTVPVETLPPAVVTAVQETPVNVQPALTNPAENKPVVKMVVTEVDRQRSIVRQSSLAQAVQYAEFTATSGSVAAVLTIAAQFEEWVNRPLDTGVRLVEPSVAAEVKVINAVERKAPGRPKKVAAVVVEAAADSEEVV